jgi:hypothetical protein
VSTDSVNPLLTAAELALCVSEKAECVACGLEAQFQQVKDPPEPAVSDMSTDTTKEHTFVPACETQLNNALLFYKANRDFEVGTSPSPNAIPKIVLKHPRKQAIDFSRKCLTSTSAGSSPTSKDTPSRELYTERKKGPRLLLVLVDQKSLSQSRQALFEILLTRILCEVRKGKVHMEEQLVSTKI